MKLYAIRYPGEMEARGIAWCNSLNELLLMIDEIVDPSDMEIKAIKEPFVIMFDDEYRIYDKNETTDNFPINFLWPAIRMDY